MSESETVTTPLPKSGNKLNVENAGIQFLYGFILTLTVIVVGLTYQMFSQAQVLMLTLVLVAFLILKESIPNMVCGLGELFRKRGK